MRNKKIIVVILILVIAVPLTYYKFKHSKSNGEIVKAVKPFRADIKNIISATATVLPKNRLEVKPPLNGRIDKILVKEGETVKAGQILAWMSSTERASLLDAARGQGEEALKYWENVYAPIPLIAPIDAEVIVATVQPGQTVTATEPVIVLSDRLIVRARVDETDIGKIKVGQTAQLSLDAYPDTKINAITDHIYYESTTINNVTMYLVDLLPEVIPDFFRSGMNASVDFITDSKTNVLLLPKEAVQKQGDKSYVLVKNRQNRQSLRREILVGVCDDKNVEIVSGISPDDIVLVKTKKYTLPAKNAGTNPFFPRHFQSQNKRR